MHAKALRAKFERWEEKEVEKERSNILNGLEQSLEQSDQTSLDTTKSLRARFESMNNEPAQNKDKVIRPKVNRFVVSDAHLWTQRTLQFTSVHFYRFIFTNRPL